MLSPDIIRRLRRMVRATWPRVRDKDDLLQEALIGAWQADAGYEICAAKRQCIDYLRRWNPGSRGGSYIRFVDIPGLQSETDIFGDLVRRDDIERLHRAVKLLSPETRPYALAVLADTRTKQAVSDISASSGYGMDNGWRLHRKAMGELRAMYGGEIDGLVASGQGFVRGRVK